MKVFKQVSFNVRIREYEQAKFEVGAEISAYDLGYDDLALSRLSHKDRDELWDRLWNTVNTEVEQQQIEALKEIAAVSPTTNLATEALQRKVTNGSSQNHTSDPRRRVAGTVSGSPHPDQAPARQARRGTAH